ncbi:Dephospho-CoA kinase [hydrothermal vent metagenome]|uniref:Dephospho-CoA kinase n=1 Tax=hydrothermal vent metagenome TaxID=652676 RepID=A0A3B0ZWS4_9ZZZZ
MLKIGLTGGIGSGKTTVSDLFYKLDNHENKVAIIDTDIIARQIVEVGKPAYKEIITVFGKDILNTNASINRKALATIIFNNPNLKQQLENITHPQIQAQVNSEISQLNTQYCIIVLPLLFETESDYALDRVLVVDCDTDTQIKRTTQRDQVTEQDVERIIKLQSSQAYRLKHADDVIKNDSNLANLRQQVQNLHEFYLKLAKQYKQ